MKFKILTNSGYSRNLILDSLVYCYGFKVERDLFTIDNDKKCFLAIDTKAKTVKELEPFNIENYKTITQTEILSGKFLKPKGNSKMKSNMTDDDDLMCSFINWGGIFFAVFVVGLVLSWALKTRERILKNPPAQNVTAEDFSPQPNIIIHHVENFYNSPPEFEQHIKTK